MAYVLTYSSTGLLYRYYVANRVETCYVRTLLPVGTCRAVRHLLYCTVRVRMQRAGSEFSATVSNGLMHALNRPTAYVQTFTHEDGGKITAPSR